MVDTNYPKENPLPRGFTFFMGNDSPYYVVVADCDSSAYIPAIFYEGDNNDLKHIARRYAWSSNTSRQVLSENRSMLLTNEQFRRFRSMWKNPKSNLAGVALTSDQLINELDLEPLPA